MISGSAGGFAWILSEWKVSVNFYPRYGERLSVQTWIEKPSSPFGISRDLIFYADGKNCVEGTTKSKIQKKNRRIKTKMKIFHPKSKAESKRNGIFPQGRSLFLLTKQSTRREERIFLLSMA